MYTCINCGVYIDELYRRYSQNVLKVVKCDKCGNLADKYIEYDPVIVLVDLVLLEKSAYRHLLYNSNFKSYWKLIIVLILGESFRKWMKYIDEPKTSSVSLSSSMFSLKYLTRTNQVLIFQDERNFYFLLVHTTLSFAVFVLAVFIITELRLLILGTRPYGYKTLNLLRALVLGSSAKLLGLFSIVWQNIIPGPYQMLIYGYTALCLLTAYSVVSGSGRTGSLIGLAGGFLAHNYVYDIIPKLYVLIINTLF